MPSEEWITLYGSDPDLSNENPEDLMNALNAEVDALEETLKEAKTPEKIVVKKEPEDLKLEKLKVKKEPKDQVTKPATPKKPYIFTIWILAFY